MELNDNKIEDQWESENDDDDDDDIDEDEMDINDEAIVSGMIQIRTQFCKQLAEDILKAVCIIVLLVCLILLQSYTIICSILFCTSVSVLCFKDRILKRIYKHLNI